VGTFGYATPKNIKNAEITFRVPITWMEANNIDPDSIQMMLYDNDWRSLPTKKIGAYNSDLLYEASTIGFSSFAIIGKKAGDQIDFQSYIKNQTALNIDLQEAQEMNNNSETTSGQVGKESNYSNYLVIGAFISVIIILILGNKIRRNRKK
jgi:hypothetical protein